MTFGSPESTSRWNHELGRIRRHAEKLSQRLAQPRLTKLLDAMVSLSSSLLQELAGSQLENERLRMKLRTRIAEWEHVIGALPTACVLTDCSGTILQGNRAAGDFLGVSSSHLKGRKLMLFTTERTPFMGILRGLEHNPAELTANLTWRPRERRPVAMEVAVIPANRDEQTWFWFLTPAARVVSQSADAARSSETPASERRA